MANHIENLQDEIAAQAAEIEALRNGLWDLKAHIDRKFVGESVVTDVEIRVLETLNYATTKHDEALMNERGPKPEASYSGWRCPICIEPLQEAPIWNDTDAKAERRMRDHWTAQHKAR